MSYAQHNAGNLNQFKCVYTLETLSFKEHLKIRCYTHIYDEYHSYKLQASIFH